jgi:hypothetical protein
MERVVKLSSFEEDAASNDYLEYWLTRPTVERIEEVERLRREFASLSKMSIYGIREGLPRVLLVLERGTD